MRIPTFSLTVAVALSPVPVSAQGTKADCDRADGLRELATGKVINERLSPNWIDHGNQFWYRTKNADGSSRFMLVDPEKGTRSDIERRQSIR